MSKSHETSYRDHERVAEGLTGLGFAIVTFSDTRTTETDTSGRLIRDLVEACGHRVVRTAIVPDDPEAIERTLCACLDDSETNVVLTNGSTGISARDTAFEVVSKLIEKRLDGFGELFRALSYAEIGAAAMLSRAIAGSVGTRILFSMPGSSNAVRLGMTKLILPQVAHIVQELAKHASPGDR
ncbi:MAG TPA: MogA/MoaB family molybdenum cofactor biosynthesis protein [Planctomycetaceae bacterium]|nr:MogA/MoaB family molybdenum cofactor biosynthesis protein [Planctomycetaceae bacterium]